MRLFLILPLFLLAADSVGQEDAARSCTELTKRVFSEIQVASQSPESVALRAEAAEWEKKALAFKAAETVRSSIRLDEPPNAFLIYGILSKLDSADIPRQPSGQAILYHSMSVDFLKKEILIRYRFENDPKELLFRVADKDFQSVIDRTHERLLWTKTVREEQAADLKLFTRGELEAVVENARKTHLLPVGELAMGRTFVHVTKSKRSLDSILRNGFRFGDGFMGDAVYAVEKKKMGALRKWMQTDSAGGAWSGNAKELTLRIVVKSDAKIVDVESKGGKRALAAYEMLLSPNERLRLSQVGLFEAYAKSMGADLIYYPWEPSMPAIAIKNLDAIERVSHQP